MRTFIRYSATEEDTAVIRLGQIGFLGDGVMTDSAKRNGILLLDKPEGWTSHDAVAKMRGVLKERRIGHSGTLDPMATGLLVLFIGRATRAVQFAEADEKEYTARLRLGVVTDTRDIWGSVTDTCDVNVSSAELEHALCNFRGGIMQVPPMYSAIKVDGKKLYELARAGKTAELEPRAVTISKLEITGHEDGDWILDIVCSKGTYIRSLCHDIGAALGCGGVMSGLRRTRAGAFSIDSARTVEETVHAVSAGELKLVPVDTLFSRYPAFTADTEQERKIRNGAAFICTVLDGRYRVYNTDGVFLMLGGVTGGVMSAVKSFY